MCILHFLCKMSDFYNIFNYDKPLHFQSLLINHALIVSDEFQHFFTSVNDFVLIWNLHTSYYNAMHPDNLKNQPFLFSDIKTMPVTASMSSNSPSISYDTFIFTSSNSSLICTILLCAWKCASSVILAIQIEQISSTLK